MTSDQFIVLKKLYNAYYQARKNKRNTPSQLAFEMDLETNLHVLYQSLLDCTYQVGSAYAFVISKPVYREVFAPQFRDRVVHHFVYEYLYPVMDKKLIRDTYSCRLNKGTGYGVERAKFFLRSVTHGYSQEAWVLKLDVSGYFMNMNRQVLYDKTLKILDITSLLISPLEKKILLYLIHQIVFNDATAHCQIRGDRSLWQYIPRSKSLFHTPASCGLPIGNLTSQLFGNIYLNDLDHSVKRHLDMRYYGRYVDDMLLLHRNKEVLKQAIPFIAEHLRAVGLSLHPKKIYLQSCNKGFYFLGQFIKPYRSYISNRTKANMYHLLEELKGVFVEENKASFTLPVLQKIQSQVNSYFGLLQYANAKHLVDMFIKKMPPYMFVYYNVWRQNRRSVLKLKKKYKEQKYGTLYATSGI